MSEGLLRVVLSFETVSKFKCKMGTIVIEGGGEGGKGCK